MNVADAIGYACGLGELIAVKRRSAGTSRPVPAAEVEAREGDRTELRGHATLTRTGPNSGGYAKDFRP